MTRYIQRVQYRAKRDTDGFPSFWVFSGEKILDLDEIILELLRNNLLYDVVNVYEYMNSISNYDELIKSPYGEHIKELRSRESDYANDGYSQMKNLIENLKTWEYWKNINYHNSTVKHIISEIIRLYKLDYSEYVDKAKELYDFRILETEVSKY